MKSDIKRKAEFEKIKDRSGFVDFYCDREDKWLQYSDMDKKVKAVFGSYKKAVVEFQKDSVNNQEYT